MNLAIFQLAACGLFQKNSLEQCSAEEINLLSSLRSTPLHYAIVGENEETVRYLVLRGALVNATNIYAESPLHWACKVGNLAIVRTLLQHKACPHAVDADGNTTLHWAAEHNHEGVVLLLGEFADASLTSTRNHDGFTPIQLAKKNDSKGALRSLRKLSRR
jgi:ankyrin repeat protein